METTAKETKWGDAWVLSLLNKLGDQARSLATLESAGFPVAQLYGGLHHRIPLLSRHGSLTPAPGAMANLTHPPQASQQPIDDDTLVECFQRAFGCNVAILMAQGHFFTAGNAIYIGERMAQEMVQQTLSLEDEEIAGEWRNFFKRYPFDLAMWKARRTLWARVLRSVRADIEGDSYRQRRGAELVQFLEEALLDEGRITITLPNPDHPVLATWGPHLKIKLAKPLQQFQTALEQLLHRWLGEDRRRSHVFEYGKFTLDQAGLPAPDVQVALAHLGLLPNDATLQSVQTAYRALSKKAHPDLGGSHEDFQHLATCRDLAEQWLRARLEENI
ncbi:MAG: hypothetical protein OEV94_06210 [Deltaproteobacteria bacterium]|nr:hypothetical protein [Deltaproteobacteria bacterium]